MKKTYLSDYCPPDFLISLVELDVCLHPTRTQVRSVLHIQRVSDSATELVLNGSDLILHSVLLNNSPLSNSHYHLSDTSVTLSLPETFKDAPFTVTFHTEISPETNLALEGLYMSDGRFCTQCEAEGFRRITYFIDRPDVMSRFNVRLEADSTRYPFLLSNGNLVESKELENGRHMAIWHDPFPKPCYLFALVAGDFDYIHDQFKTVSGRSVDLEIYCEKGRASQCEHAMRSLKKAMTWDETRYGREYDLDRFMIVAVSSFNMGAMENKGLNIFNDALILADSSTATDDDYLRIEAVVAHEYFHNWTGNRITCRDWFQLTLKEGLTVFRDQMFSADMNSESMQRIMDVAQLRDIQFAEDASPTAHPIRPESYVEIDNFYTSTVYDKGAEIIRMIYHLLGPEAYRKGMDRYFDMYDGQAVTTDDFLDALVMPEDFDVTLFKRWYHQAGTPRIHVDCDYDSEKQHLRMHFTQHAPTNFPENKPVLIPFSLGFIGANGEPLSVSLGNPNAPRNTTHVLHLTQSHETVVFHHVPSLPTPSLLRDFSAPVKVTSSLSLADIAHLSRFDPNLFNRYDAFHRLATSLCLDHYTIPTDTVDISLIFSSIDALFRIDNADHFFISKCLELPTLTAITTDIKDISFSTAFSARETLRNAIGTRFQNEFMRLFKHLREDPSSGTNYDLSPNAMGRRRLQNICLMYATLSHPDGIECAYDAFQNASTMTEQLGALRALLSCTELSSAADAALLSFYDQWKDHHLIMDKWLSIQASRPYGHTLDKVRELRSSDIYDTKNPNRIRALIGSFCRNLSQFHKEDASGYAFLCEEIQHIDTFNPQIAARLALAFRIYPRLSESAQSRMRPFLDTLHSTHISPQTREVISMICST